MTGRAEDDRNRLNLTPGMAKTLRKAREDERHMSQDGPTFSVSWLGLLCMAATFAAVVIIAVGTVVLVHHLWMGEFGG